MFLLREPDLFSIRLRHYHYLGIRIVTIVDEIFLELVSRELIENFCFLVTSFFGKQVTVCEVEMGQLIACSLIWL